MVLVCFFCCCFCTDNMENWDENKLREVVQKKGNKCQTEIICRFFLEAIETKKYGFFWECPNGGNQCHYRHALPPGYVFQSKKKKEDEEDEEDKPSLEDQLEDQRRALKTSTPLTLELFLKWKEDKRLAREKVTLPITHVWRVERREEKSGLGHLTSDLFFFQHNRWQRSARRRSRLARPS